MSATGQLRRLASFAARYLHAAALVAYSFTFGLASPRRRRLIRQLAREANYQQLPRPSLPSVPIESITNEVTSVALPYPQAADGNVSLLELFVLARLARERSPAALFEIGTFNGRSAAAMAANTPDSATVFTLDLPPHHATRFQLLGSERAYVEKPSSGELLRNSPFESKVKQLYGDSAAFDFAPYKVDFVFVDGSHAYEYVMSDSYRALSMLRDGRGLVLWHDYGEWEGVTRALNELHERDLAFANLRHIDGTTLAMLEK
ncbi:MAG: class I SAM-dependent methyltransferase [Gammaproteobacteria bacterium]